MKFGTRSGVLGAAFVVSFAGQALAVDTCATLNIVSPISAGFSLNMSGNVVLQVGDRVSMETTNPGGQNFTLNIGTAGPAIVGQTPSTVSTSVTSAGQVTVRGSITGAGNLPTASGSARIFCSPGGSGGAGDPTAPASQAANNAQSAVTFGKIVLQNYNDRIAKGVLGSFGLMTGGQRKPKSVADQADSLSVVDQLKRRERDQREELADLQLRSGSGDDVGRAARIHALEQGLAYTRQNLALALDREPRRGPEDRRNTFELDTLSPRAPDRSATSPPLMGPQGRSESTMSALQLDKSDVLNACAASGGGTDTCDLVDPRWNAWLEGRVIGGADTLFQANSLGFMATAGGDYKVRPWLALGLSGGVETFGTSFFTPGTSASTFGVSVVPYVGVRLPDNLYASAFAGFTSISYNVNPAATVTSSFSALRWFGGGALMGDWREGPWRFQPMLAGTLGTENQVGYTDSVGNAVSAQGITFGRIWAGPEVGYAFGDLAYGWVLEPFVMGRIGVDFSSTATVAFNSFGSVSRPATTAFGSVGGGVAMRLDNGGYLRAQGSYDSIGVGGLSLWSAALRLGMTF